MSEGIGNLKSRTVKAEQGGKFTGYVRLRLVVPVAEVWGGGRKVKDGAFSALAPPSLKKS